ncbi:MAG TPA: erythromycin esterase family protein [Caldimonas sp.]|jgi:erythromycin esterase-like protein|nr:erythromycin esterase family protein [Caldimonas sp.]
MPFTAFRPSAAALAAVQDHAVPLAGPADDDRGLIDLLAGARFALLGEASHGTDDFYRERAAITRRLIVEGGLDAVAVEADWPDAYRVNRYVRGLGDDASADVALSDFKRFPAWMWRNTVVLEFVEWLREHNAGAAPADRVGFYGLDLYSLFSSIEAVLDYLDRTDPEAARRARDRYACFERFAEDSQAYGYATRFDLDASCEQAVVAQLREMVAHGGAVSRGLADDDPDAFFHAEQNARLVMNAEAYYRSMFSARVSSWNLRDQHMAETLAALDGHLAQRRGRPARFAVWAHNSHLGDARATEMGENGELNLGQIVRERHGAAAALLGFSTDHGTVTAASDWDAPAETKRVRPGLGGSYEALFHEVDSARFRLILRGNDELAEALAAPRLERAIGVIYRPETERQSHYFHARLVRQFDAIVHLDATRALAPLDRPDTVGAAIEPPETYPSGV